MLRAYWQINVTTWRRNRVRLRSDSGHTQTIRAPCLKEKSLSSELKAYGA